MSIGLMSPSPLTRAAHGSGGITGASTAGMGTVEALVRRGSRPYRLYAARAGLGTVRGEVQRLNVPPGRDIYPLAQLPEHLAAGSLRALHTYTSSLHSLAAARARYAPSVVPLTAMQYSISQVDFQYGCFLHYFLCDLYPCDAVLCTTRCARDAQLRVLARIAEALAPSMGPRTLPLRHEVIPYPVDTEFFRPCRPEEKAHARKSLGLPLAGHLVLYVGRFEPATKSDLSVLLLAFRQARSRLNPSPKNGKENGPASSDVHLVLAGYDPSGELPHLRKLADEFGFGDRLHVFTNYPPAQQPLYYWACDQFVSLSDTLQENFGLTPVEAMACGLPVTVSDWAGYQETVRHGETGFKVAASWGPEEDDLVGLSGLLPWTEAHLPLSQAVLVDPAEVADRIVALAENEALRHEMGRAGRQHAVESFGDGVVVARMEALWDELSEQARFLEKRPAAPVSLYEARYGQDLRPYASGWVQGGARLLLTDYGREVLGGALSLPLSESMGLHYSREVLTGLLGVLKSGSLLNRGLPLAEVAEQSARRFGMSVPSAKRHLLWLVKHGLALIKG